MVQEKIVIGKVARRFVPLLITAAFLAYLDRSTSASPPSR